MVTYILQSRSPRFHGPVILPYILNIICWINVTPGILLPCDPMNDHLLYLGHCDWRPGGRGFNPRRGRQHSFVEIDYEIFSTVILSLPLIQEGQLSVSGEIMCTILVNRLED